MAKVKNGLSPSAQAWYILGKGCILLAVLLGVQMWIIQKLAILSVLKGV